MELVLYAIAAGSGLAEPAQRHALTEHLRAAGAHGIQINVADAAVAPAACLRFVTSSAPAEALVSVWVDSATDHLRASVDDAITEAAATPDVVGGKSGATAAPETPSTPLVTAYLVTESVPLVDDQPPGLGERTRGFAQLAFIRRTPSLSTEKFLDLWLRSHTQVALDLQDTFAYNQNAVVRPLTPDAPPLDAIVEECFPAPAMSDPHAFFDAVGDDDRLARHQTEMFESVQRFIDLSSIDVIPTSRYVMTRFSA